MKSGSDRDSGTFIVKILNSDNSTWHGTITWIEKQKVQNFRSALELIKLIDGALDKKHLTDENSEEE